MLGRMDAPARQVIEERASHEGAPLYSLDREFRCDGDSTADCGYTGPKRAYQHLQLSAARAVSARQSGLCPGSDELAHDGGRRWCRRRPCGRACSRWPGRAAWKCLGRDR